MFDPQTEGRLRHLLDLAAHPGTPQSERENALNGVRAVLFGGGPPQGAANSTSSALLTNLRTLTQTVDEDLIYAVLSVVHSSRFGGKKRELVESLELACNLWMMWASPHAEFDVRTSAMKLLAKLEDGAARPPVSPYVQEVNESDRPTRREGPQPIAPKREWRRI